MRSAGAELRRLGGGVHADLVAQRPAEQAVDRHAPEFARDVPQSHVDGRDDVDHDRAAAHVAVGSVQLLPEVLDAGGVFAVEQLEERLGQDGGHLRLAAGDLAPADDVLVGLDLEEGLGSAGNAAEAGDFDVGAAVLDADGVGGGGARDHQTAGGGEAHRSEHFAAVEIDRGGWVRHGRDSHGAGRGTCRNAPRWFLRPTRRTGPISYDAVLHAVNKQVSRSSCVIDAELEVMPGFAVVHVHTVDAVIWIIRVAPQANIVLRGRAGRYTRWPAAGPRQAARGRIGRWLGRSAAER